jgi:hypothetical protein
LLSFYQLEGKKKKLKRREKGIFKAVQMLKGFKERNNEYPQLQFNASRADFQVKNIC